MAGNNYGSGALSFDVIPEAVPIANKRVRVKGVMISLTVLFVILTCIMAIVISTQSPVSTDTVVQKGIIWGKKSLPGSQKLCLSPMCVQQAMTFSSYIDDTANPCTDFYQYACGGFTSKIQRLGYGNGYSVKTLLDENNLKLSFQVLENDIAGDPKSAEYKAKKLYALCNDDFDNDMKGSQLMVDVINNLGGLDLFGTFDDKKWSLSAAVEKSHVDYMSSSFFRIGFQESISEPKKNIFKISRSGLGLNPDSYYKPALQHNLDSYKLLIKTVMTLLVRDAKASATLEDIEKFVDDVILEETDLAIAYSKSPSYDPEEITVKEWMKICPQIDWKALLEDVLGKGTVTDDTKIYSTDRLYANELNTVLGIILDKRVYHHYITWMVVFDYILGMGWEYTQAYREFRSNLLRTEVFPSRKEYCRRVVDGIMPYLLDHLFVSHIFNGDNLINMKIISKMLDDTYLPYVKTWMSNDDVSEAEAKLNTLVKNIGFPDWMKNPGKVNQIYDSFVIDEKDFLQSLINAGQFKKNQIRDEILNPRNDDDWNIDIMRAREIYNPSENKIIYPAGILRRPFYDKENQAYLNFGAIGSSLSKDVASSIINPGKKYDQTGAPKNWWSKETQTTYTKFESCLENKLPDMIKIKDIDGSVVMVPTPKKRFASQASQDVHAVDMALEAYLKGTGGGGEFPIPGLKYSSARQLFFIAYAQSQCIYNDPDQLKFMLMLQRLPTSVKVDLVAKNSAIFQSEFVCNGIGGRPRPSCRPKK